jgi:hypothetical protein
MDQHLLSTATWFWLFVPMPLVVVLSLLNFLKQGRKDR